MIVQCNSELSDACIVTVQGCHVDVVLRCNRCSMTLQFIVYSKHPKIETEELNNDFNTPEEARGEERVREERDKGQRSNEEGRRGERGGEEKDESGGGGGGGAGLELSIEETK